MTLRPKHYLDDSCTLNSKYLFQPCLLVTTPYISLRLNIYNVYYTYISFSFSSLKLLLAMTFLFCLTGKIKTHTCKNLTTLYVVASLWIIKYLTLNQGAREEGEGWKRKSLC